MVLYSMYYMIALLPFIFNLEVCVNFAIMCITLSINTFFHLYVKTLTRSAELNKSEVND